MTNDMKAQLAVSPLRRFADAPARRLADFYELTKPRLNFLVIITTAVGYYMGIRSAVDWLNLLHALLGTALTAGGSSVLNQYLERHHDARMPRTADRPLPAGRVLPLEALLFGLALSIVGVAYLAAMVNPLTALLGAFSLLAYVLIYTPLKRYTPLNTVIGAVPGAIPFVMGWTAVRGQIEPQAVALFGILFLWQMPHFLAIAILYRDDYAKAGFKMLPVLDPNLNMTSRQIVLYLAALIPVSLAPVAMHMAGTGYLLAALLLGIAFLSLGIACATSRRRQDARRLFLASILYLPLLLGGMMLDKL